MKVQAKPIPITSPIHGEALCKDTKDVAILYLKENSDIEKVFLALCGLNHLILIGFLELSGQKKKIEEKEMGFIYSWKLIGYGSDTSIFISIFVLFNEYRYGYRYWSDIKFISMFILNGDEYKSDTKNIDTNTDIS